MTQKGKRGHGEGQITVLARDKVQWRVWLTYPSGQRRRVSGTAASKREASEAISSALKAATQGRYQESKTLTIAEMVQDHMQAKAGEWSYRSRVHNSAIYTRHMHAHLGNMKAAGVRPQDLRAYYQGLSAKGLGWSSQHQLHSLLSGAYKQAIGDGVLQDNPTLHVKPIRPRRTAAVKKAFNADEAQRFYRIAISERWAMPLAFMLLTGLRPGEALGLQWTDIVPDDGCPINDHGEPTAYWARISRTRSEFQGQTYEGTSKTMSSQRDIHITDEALIIINRMREYVQQEADMAGKTPTPYVFPSVRVTPMRQDSLRQIMERVCDLADVPRLSPHKLRHTYATLMHAAGANIGRISSTLGHSNITTTLTFYRSVFKEERRNMILKLHADQTSPPANDEEPVEN